MRNKLQGLRPYLPHSLCAVLLFAAVLPVTLLSGCGGSRATQYYVLDSSLPMGKAGLQKEMPEKSATRVTTTVSIRQIDIPQYLDKPRLVRRDAGNQLRIAEYHQWGGNLRDNIARTLADNLAARLGSATVSMAPFPGSVDAGIFVLLDIRQFERMPDGFVHMQVQWHVDGRSGTLLSRLEHFSSQARVGEDDYAGMASAMSGLLGLLSDHLAAAIQGKIAVVEG